MAFSGSQFPSFSHWCMLHREKERACNQWMVKVGTKSSMQEGLQRYQQHLWGMGKNPLVVNSDSLISECWRGGSRCSNPLLAAFARRVYACDRIIDCSASRACALRARRGEERNREATAIAHKQCPLDKFLSALLEMQVWISCAKCLCRCRVAAHA